MEYRFICISKESNEGIVRLRSLVSEVSGQWRVFLFISSADASFLFETFGRPDLGLKLEGQYVFCDWLIKIESLVRAYAIEMEELRDFRARLISKLANAKTIAITTRNGTNIVANPRFWNETDGEVYTAPIEHATNGSIYIDGCAYGGPPAAPFGLVVEDGRVVGVDHLNRSDPQQAWVFKDLTRDKNSNVVGELGIGINPGARWDEELMESERTRGTCHFGFGHNIAYGGVNESSYHFDLAIRQPTIRADGNMICRDGEYRF